MRSSSNPAFRNLPTGGGYGGYAGFGQPDQAGYQQAPPPLTSERPMTIDDVVTKTGITLGVVAVGAVATFVTGLYFLAFPAAIVGLVLALIIMFKRNPSPPLVIAYAVAEGIFLGGISYIIGNALDRVVPGNGIAVIGQAVIGTLGVFLGMLVVYKTGAVRVTPKFTKWITGAIIGVGVLMLFNFILSFFGSGEGLGIRSGGPIAIIFSLVCIGLAAFSFLIDFDAADQAIRAGVPAKYAWQIAFGLTVTLVWLYTEILRLLSYFNSD
ncbi:Bax inhibitor-1/YccA family protein [Lentzea sp. NPDC058450]|uniref:Bax inhibitor-1/YccA family protein n=1 Tax=Lentzea sp. NPDC058450 TaxID=3346505 RepID=UPI00365341BC